MPSTPLRNTPVDPGPPRRSASGADSGAGSGSGAGASAGVWLPAVAVFAPLISAATAVTLLVLGYGAHLAGTDPELAESLTATGWISTAFAVGTTAIGLAALLISALRHRTSTTPRTRIRTASAATPAPASAPAPEATSGRTPPP
ncbi:hypothetical protein [Streptomyces sp. Da 82-17]|uniref:hypothetical protein n=1 Tax=Streptomyces sp. Da 82-17 TaxID=3377116 RepID=UPI0038D3BCB0